LLVRFLENQLRNVNNYYWLGESGDKKMGVIIDVCSGCGREVWVVVKEMNVETGENHWQCPECYEDNEMLIAIMPD